MSVLIKGMEMPTEGTVIAIYKLNGQFYASVQGTELCPIIPVPPHGQLIDLSTVDLSDGPYEYDDWVEWALEKYQDAPIFAPADPPKEKA